MEMNTRLRKIAIAQIAFDNAAQVLAGRAKTLEEMGAGLVRELEAGATTGDRLQDLVTRLHGWSPDILKEFRRLEGRLKGKKGQFAVLDFVADVPYKHTFGKGIQTKRERCYRVGVLDDEELVELKDGYLGCTISLPVPRYIAGHPSPIYGTGDIRLPDPVEKNIFIREHGGLFCKGNPDTLSALIARKTIDAAVIIGDEDVKRWLEARTMPGLYRPTAEALRKFTFEAIAET